MVDTTKKLIAEIREVKDLMKEELGSNVFDSMDANTFKLMKRMFDLIETSEDLLLKQAYLLENIDHKLDRLLNKTES